MQNWRIFLRTARLVHTSRSQFSAKGEQYALSFRLTFFAATLDLRADTNVVAFKQLFAVSYLFCVLGGGSLAAVSVTDLSHRAKLEVVIICFLTLFFDRETIVI